MGLHRAKVPGGETVGADGGLALLEAYLMSMQEFPLGPGRTNDGQDGLAARQQQMTARRFKRVTGSQSGARCSVFRAAPELAGRQAAR